MKKITFYLALLGIWLYGVQVFPQSSLLLLMSDDGYKNAETTLYANAMTTKLSKEQLTRIDTFVSMLKDSLAITSLSQKFDVMYLLANETEEAGLRNLVKRSHDATAVNSPTFTQWEGYTGNGLSSYLNTNYNPNTQGVNYLQNSASLGAYIRTTTNNLKTLMGSYDGTNYTQLFESNGTTNAQLNLNNGSIVNTQTTTQGFNVGSRTGATAGGRYLNGVINSTTVNASAVVVNRNITILARLTNATVDNYSTNQVSFAFLGGGLSGTEITKLYNCIQWYMTQLGKQV